MGCSTVAQPSQAQDWDVCCAGAFFTPRGAAARGLTPAISGVPLSEATIWLGWGPWPERLCAAAVGSGDYTSPAAQNSPKKRLRGSCAELVGSPAAMFAALVFTALIFAALLFTALVFSARESAAAEPWRERLASC